MRVHCTNCGRDGHAKWQCTRPTKSTEACKAMPNQKDTGQSALNAGVAGSAPLPVDTHNPSSPKGSGVESLRTKGLASPAKVRDAETANTKDALIAGSSNGRTAPFDGVNAGSTPAPASKFDKVAYQRVYMAKWRSEIKSGKRVPKRKGE